MFYIYAGNELLYEPGNSKLFVFSPKLTLEMGKAGSLEFSVPSVNPLYSNLQQMKTGVSVFMDDEELFRGRVLSNKRNFNNTRDIYTEGTLAYLVDSVQKAEKYNGKARQLFRNIIAAHNKMVADPAKQFTVGTITVDDRDVYIVGQSDQDGDIYEDLETKSFNYKQIAINSIADEWQNTFDYIESCLTDYCGGYLRVRTENGVNYIDWLKDYYTLGTQTISVGRNMLDLTEEVSIEDAFTVLIPLGDENLTIETAPMYNADGISHAAGSVEIVDTASVEKYGRIVKTNVFDGVNTVETLFENAKRYIKNNINIPTTLTVTAVDLHLIDSNIRAIHLGDKMRIQSDYHEIDDEYICTKIEYDLGNPANTIYTFGNPKQTLTERYRKDQKKQNEAAKRGGGGGGGGAGKKAEETSKKDLDEFFDAWINVDKAAGHISLGTLYKKTDEALKTAGINIDAPSGQVNIYATSEKLENTITKLNKVGIDLNADQGTIDIYADHTERIKDREILKKNVGIDLDAPGGTINVYSVAKNVETGEEHMAKIYTWAGYDQVTKQFSTKVGINADVITLGGRIDSANAKLVQIDTDLLTINSKLTKINGIVNVETGHVNATIIARPGSTYYIGGSQAGFDQHSHKITVSGGTVTLGNAFVGTSSFNIADTKFYKDGVSAVTVSSISLTPHTVPTFIKTTKRYALSLSAVTTNDKTKNNIAFQFDASAAYNAGVSDTNARYSPVSVTKQGAQVTSVTLYYKLGSNYYRYNNAVYTAGSTSTYYKYS